MCILDLSRFLPGSMRGGGMWQGSCCTGASLALSVLPSGSPNGGKFSASGLHRPVATPWWRTHKSVLNMRAVLSTAIDCCRHLEMSQTAVCIDLLTFYEITKRKCHVHYENHYYCMLSWNLWLIEYSEESYSTCRDAVKELKVDLHGVKFLLLLNELKSSHHIWHIRVSGFPNHFYQDLFVWFF